MGRSSGSGGTALADIKRAAPALTDEQADDVRFIEARLYEQGKPGSLLTNGTGTGKTFSGLGAAKRAIADRDAKHILVVAPSDKIGSDWVDTAHRFFDIGDAAQLTSTVDNGGTRKLVVTTYANLSQNNELVKRPWDMIIADEAHYLSQNENGDPTDALHALRALTFHPRGVNQRVKMLEPEATEGAHSFRQLEQHYFKLNKKLPLEQWKHLSLEQQKQWDAFKATIAAREKLVRAEFEAKAESSRPKALFMSATPFAYRKNVDYAEGFLFDYGKKNESSAYNTPSPYQQFMIDNFGYSMRYGKLTEPENATATGILERRFAERLMREKSMRGRALVVPYDYSREFVLTESQLGKKLDDIITHMMSTDRMRTLSKKIGVTDYLQRRFLLEALKAREAIPRIREHIALGRKVVVFHDYKLGGALNPLTPLFEPGAVAYITIDGRKETVYLEDAFAELRAHFPDWEETSAQLNGLESPIVQFKAAFSPEELGVFNGSVPKKERRKLVEMFNDPKGKMRVTLNQRASSKEGISLHDRGPDHQRILIDLGLPSRPTDAIQVEGRIYRIGVKSDAINEYLITGTNFERWTFAQTVAQRASTAENLAMGEGARSLLQAFTTGFNEAEAFAPHSGQGKGGKEADAVRERGNPYLNAVALYYTNQKKTSRTRSSEGIDYFATPEPLGFKMVEWSGVQPGEKFLEPSAGHGAIARFAPDSTTRHAVEPSNELAGRLALNAPDTEVHNVRFEDFNIVNKFDAIAMNSPWGTSGKTAMEHLEKALKHLKDGGRVVALIPAGPSMDKRVFEFLESNAIDLGLHTRAEIKLPSIVFKRAGTTAIGKILVIDKSTGEVPGGATLHDLSDITDIKELFDRLEHLGVPARPEKKIIEPEPEEEKEAKGPAPKGGYVADPLKDRKPVSPDHTLAKPSRESDFKPAEFIHTKNNTPVFVAQTARYMSRPEFLAAKEHAKKLGGYYSSFKGAGAIPGFHFKTAEARDKFLGGGPAGIEKLENPLSERDSILPTERETLERQITTLEYRMSQDKKRSITRPEDVARLEELKKQLAEKPPAASVPLKPTTEKNITEQVKAAAAGPKVRKAVLSEARKAATESGEASWKKMVTVASAASKGLSNFFTKLPPVSDYKAAKGEWLGAGLEGEKGEITTGRQQAAHEARIMLKEINKKFGEFSQKAITRYNEAGGDVDKLTDQAASSTSGRKAIYEKAANLTPEEKEMARIAKDFFLAKGEEAQKLGMLGDLLENYVTHFVDQSSIPSKKKAAVKQQLFGVIATSRLKTRFDQAIQRTFESIFDLEQQGYRLHSTKIGEIMSAYAQAFNNTVADRTFVKLLSTMEASDGNPIAVVSGYAKPSEGDGDPTLVSPNSRPDKSIDYKSIPHPALRKWKWVGKDAAGQDVLLEGELLIHPEVYQDLKNTLSRSAMADVPGIRELTKLQYDVKQTMLGLSGFHFVQVGTHAVGHTVNPIKPVKIDFTQPLQRELVNGGLMVASFDAKREFSEGLSSTGLIGKIPWIGPLNDEVTGILFEDYIPRLKMTMALHALERNLKRFKKELDSGQITRAQVAQKTAQQSNDAFGEQNYRYMGSNPTFWHTLRLLLLAPDFLISRLKFAADAFTKYGGEQRRALIILAVAMMVAAKMTEKMLTGKNHWDKPFAVIAGDRQYELRNVPADVMELVQDPRRFISGRLSPVVSRTTLEAITGRDYRGVKRSALDQFRDAIQTPIPISLRGFVDRKDISAGEMAMNAAGARIKRYSEITESRKLGHKWQIEKGFENPDEAYPPSKYLPIKQALEDKDKSRATKEIAKLVSTEGRERVATGFKMSISKPFSGSQARETEFKASLSDAEKELVDRAIIDQKTMIAEFNRIIQSAIIGGAPQDLASQFSRKQSSRRGRTMFSGF